MYNDSFKIRFKKAPIAVSETVREDTLPHIHKEFEIILVISGSARVKTGVDEFTVCEGDMVFVNPMEVHSLYPNKDQKYFHRCICFDLSLISDGNISSSFVDGSLTAVHVLKNGSTAYLSEIFRKLFSVAETGEETLPLEAGAYVSLIFAHMIKVGAISGKSRMGKKSDFYFKVMKYISENYANDISSLAPATEMFYTQSHFCRTFAKNFGIPFSAFLNIYRVTKAKELLENSNEKISSVASGCGFTNFSYFTKSFKKYVGMSPSEYRKYQYNTKNTSKQL